MTWNGWWSGDFSATLGGLTPGETYWFRAVAGYSWPGSGNTAPTTAVSEPSGAVAITLGAPEAPWHLSADPLVDAAQLSWVRPQHAGLGIEHYLVEARVSAAAAGGASTGPDSDWTIVRTLTVDGDAAAITLVVDGLSSAATYEFRVRAANGAAAGAPSNVAAVTPLGTGQSIGVRSCGPACAREHAPAARGGDGCCARGTVRHDCLPVGDTYVVVGDAVATQIGDRLRGRVATPGGWVAAADGGALPATATRFSGPAGDRGDPAARDQAARVSARFADGIGMPTPVVLTPVHQPTGLTATPRSTASRWHGRR